MSKAWISGLSSEAFPSAALMPPSAAPECDRVGWIFEIIADVRSGVEGLDGRAHACAAGPDDQDVVLSDHSV